MYFRRWLYGVVALLILSSSWVSAGGGWVSTGGELQKDQHNPWFIQNTAAVYYCVLVDRSSVSAGSEQIELLIQQAIREWKLIFADYENAHIGVSTFQVATQQFVQIPCTGMEDLRFQVGWSTLTREQRVYLSQKDPRTIMGETIRTAYDETHLRGKGFIFIASDLGPDRYQSDAHVIEEAWRYPALLHWVIFHELGHVFGVPHVGEEVMSESFLEWVTNKHWLKLMGADLNQIQPFSNFFISGAQFVSCHLSREDRDWLGVDSNCHCLRFDENEENGTDPQSFKLSHVGPAGELKTDASFRYSMTEIQFDPVVSLYLTNKQSVLSWDLNARGHRILGPGFVHKIYRGVILLPGQKPRPAVLRKGKSLIIESQIGDRIRPVLGEFLSKPGAKKDN